MDKQCRKCKTSKKEEEFTWSARDGYSNLCKQCSKEYMAAKRKDPDFMYSQKARKFKTDVDTIKTLYETYKSCQICNQTDRRALNVDHCHDTGKVRGLLCDNCNKALGLFRDNPKLLGQAANYLRRYSEHR